MKKFVRYSFLILLVISCLIVVPGCLLQTHLPDAATTTTTTETTTEATTTTTITTTLPTADAVTTTKVPATDAQTTTSIPTTIANGTTVVPPATSTTSTVSTTKPTTPLARSFPNTLFIGDSRTDGLRLYGKIQDATFFCVQSMSSFNTLKKELDVKGFGKTTLSNLLDKKQFETVYLMLGINELGYNLDTITAKYKEIVDVVKQKQPNAIVVVQASLHVTEAKDKDNSVFTNARINDLNKRLATLANKDSGIFFIDPNPAFDDANGNMRAEYSKDGVHYYGKYYPLWSEFLDNNRVTK